MNSISTGLDHPHCSMPTARIIQSIAISEPTEISIPPVSMTQVIPAVTQISPALLIRIFKKVCRRVKPLSAYTAHPAAYMTKNRTIVIRSSRLLLLIFFFFMPVPPPFRISLSAS